MKTHKREWFDNDAFWRELYPSMFPEAQRLVARNPR